MQWLRKRLMSTALTVAASLIALQLVVPGIFDFVFDLMLLGIIYAVGKLSEDKK